MISAFDAAMHFRQEAGFSRLFEKFIARYKELGRIGGNVLLSNLTLDEKRALNSVFHKKDYSHLNSTTVSMGIFEAALKGTKFEDIPLIEILKAYHGSPVVTNAQYKDTWEKKKHLLFDSLKCQYIHLNSQDALQKIMRHAPGTQGIHAFYKKEPLVFERQFPWVLRALEYLPAEKPIRISFFASKVTGNPHAFDIGSDTDRAGNLLISILQLLGDSHMSVNTAEDKNELFESFGLVPDDILNQVSITGLEFYDKDSQQITLRSVITNMPLKEVIRASSVKSITRKAYVVENSGVFSTLCDNICPGTVLLCTHGQVKLAGLLIMDKLVNFGFEIYYAGDFDPEGLQIAQKLKLRYGGHLKLWRYCVSDYEKTNPQKTLSHARLKKLASITTDGLTEVARAIQSEGRAGYQEELAEKYLGDLSSRQD